MLPKMNREDEKDFYTKISLFIYDHNDMNLKIVSMINNLILGKKFYCEDLSL